MDAANRRQMILETIKACDAPITGSELAARLDVTRQVVVQDVALLRAGGAPIIATPSGYMMVNLLVNTRPMRVFTCRHRELQEAEKELMIIVEGGGIVRDVIIEHPIYGEITGSLMISTREAVRNLIDRLQRKDSLMLSSVTDGIHLHTVEAAGEYALNAIENRLREAGILLQQ